MIFDTNSKDIICINFPTGGFGNFFYQILTVFAQETIKPTTSTFNFSFTGDSHNNEKLTNIYHSLEYDPWIAVDFENKIIPVLCDFGINNDSTDHIVDLFPNAKILRIVINHAMRPVVYQTCIKKALTTTPTEATTTHVQSFWPDASEDYAIRENFTIFYHNWAYGWLEDTNVINFNLEHLIANPQQSIFELFKLLNLTLINSDMLNNVINQWITLNQQYFKIYSDTITILSALDKNQNIDISNITNLHDQGYINYCIESKYNVTIPVYDYKTWFRNTNEIKLLVEKYV